MKRILGLGAVICLALSPLAAETALAHKSGYYKKSKSVRYYRAAKPKVYGYVVRPGGGYSYTVEDVINTYGDSRTRFGSTNFFRDPMADRQTPFGPFDHGFFFDSAIGPQGGDAPYQQ
ncbi:MAG: hypothetical protein DIU63_03425 [Proteobacteria bacterium]|jgi:hypothetical protein|nr:MAG: hypothetical protein DIU63_03425 [Pseudomonadota bacterium]